MDVDLPEPKPVPQPQPPKPVPQPEPDKQPIDYFQSAAFLFDLEKSINAARSKKAAEVLARWEDEARNSDDDTGLAWIEEQKNDIKKYVSDFRDELDRLLLEEDGFDAKNAMDDGSKKTGKRGSNYDDNKDEEELVDSELSGPPTKK
jgi:hypothetical protein